MEKQLYQKLKEKGLKLTPARKYMLHIFAASENKLLNATEIYNLVREKDDKINFSTIYRNLETLLEHEIIEKISYNEETKYKLHEPGPHYHLMICTLCQKTKPLPFCPLEKLENHLKNDTDFLPLQHHVEIYGYCQDCRPPNKKAPNKKEPI